MENKVRNQLTRMVKDKKIQTDTEGRPVRKDGEIVYLHFDRYEYASEIAKRLGVTRRTVRKARQGRLAALDRIKEAVGV